MRLPGEAGAGVAGALMGAATRPKRRSREKSGGLPPYNVVLLDDDDHSYEYVIFMLRKLFGYPVRKGYELAREVDTTGRAVVATTHLEEAELKRDQIQSFGPDPLIPRCKGSMRAVVEPAPG